MIRIAQDFATLFNVLWYRDFPLAYKVKEAGRRAEWTTHIAVCVRSAADLLGYFTHFEAGTRTDAVIKDATGQSIANVEWEWLQPSKSGFNEVEKLYAAKNSVKFSVLVTYSRDIHHDDNLRLLKKQWGKASELLLAFIVRYEFSRGRNFGDLETYRIQNGAVKRIRHQPALPWQRPDTRWATSTADGES